MTTDLGNLIVYAQDDIGILEGNVSAVSHYGFVRDYIITLETGEYILIPSKAVRAIVEHEREEGADYISNPQP